MGVKFLLVFAESTEMDRCICRTKNIDKMKKASDKTYESPYVEVLELQVEQLMLTISGEGVNDDELM